MNMKVKKITEEIFSVISRWPGVECICLNETARVDFLDSYFALIFDVYYEGEMPGIDERTSVFPNASMFETSPLGTKDRVMLEDIPVRIEYKSMNKVGTNLGIAASDCENLWRLKDSGTYGFYRLLNSEILFNKSGWIVKVRKQLENLPDVFWNKMRDFYQTTMEHYLMDLGAAAVQNDAFFYQVSLSGYLKFVTSVLFMVNHTFEPSHKSCNEQVHALDILPSGFEGFFDSLLRIDGMLDAQRKFKIAEQLAKTVINLRS